MNNTSLPSSDRSSSNPGMGSPASTSGLSGSTYSGGSGSMGGAGSGGPQAREAVDRLQESAHGTVDRLANTARGWADKLDERTRGLSDMPMRAWDASRSTVQAYPMQAILLSMLLGYVMGRFGGGRTTHDVTY